MAQKYKVIEINGKRYQVGKLDARTASYIAGKLAIILGGAAGNNSNLSAAVSSLKKEDFIAMQNDCLSVVNRLNVVNGAEVPEAILLADGRFTDPDMEYDFSAVLTLTVNVLMYNVSGFFGGNDPAAVLKKILSGTNSK